MEMEIKATIANFSIKDLKPGNELTKTMPSGVMVINETEIPFVLRRRSWGKIEVNLVATRISVLHFSRGYKTRFTKAGYVSFLLTTEPTQFWFYIKAEHVKKLLSAITVIDL